MSVHKEPFPTHIAPVKSGRMTDTAELWTLQLEKPLHQVESVHVHGAEDTLVVTCRGREAKDFGAEFDRAWCYVF